MAIGDLVATLSVAGVSGATFSLESNPGGYFAISGNSVIEAINTPNGSYDIVLTAAWAGGPGNTQPFVLTYHVTPPPVTHPSLDFSKPKDSMYVL